MSVDSIGGRNRKLIRKALDAVVFAAPADAEPITTLTDENGELLPLPTSYIPLGLHTKEEGLNWSREVENSDTTSHGSQEPTRRDITSDVSGLVVIAQETKAQVLKMFNNIEDEAFEVLPNGEVQFSRSTTPSTKHYRILAVGEDGSGDNKVYFGRFLPNASVTEYAEQSWTDGEEIRYELTLTAYKDDELGYSLREFIGGPGTAALLDDMGFNPAAS